MNFLQKFWPLFFLITLWFIFASPYFLKGLVPYSGTYQVNNFAPWSHYQQFWGPVKNGAMPDVTTQIYPWKKFTIDQLKQGQIPWWNPYNFSGNPHVANFQTAVFSPFNLLYFVLPFLDAWSIVVLLQPLLAGLFMYALLREFSISKSGSVLGAISYMFCGFITVWMAYGTLSMAIAFLPLVLHGIERTFRKPTVSSTLTISIAIALSLFSGHFQTSLYVLLFSSAFFLFKFFSTKQKKASLFVFSGFTIGLILSLPQLLPTVQQYSLAPRSEIFLKSGGIPIQYLITIFSPDFFGNPVTRNDWFGSYAEWASFIGIIPFFLAFITLAQKRNKLVYFFFISGLIALILAMESPLLSILGSLQLPVLSTSTPSRIIVLFSFAFSVLAGFGLDNLVRLLEKRETKKLIPAAALIVILLGVALVILFVIKPFDPDRLAIAKRNIVLPAILFAGGVGAVFLQHVLKHKKTFFFLPLLFIFLTSFDSLRYVQKWMPFDPRALVFPDVPVTAEIKERIGNGRIYGNLGNEVNVYYGISSIEGYDPLYIGRYGELIASAEKGQPSKSARSVVQLARNGKYTDRILDLLGVNLIFHPIADTNQGWAYPVWKDDNRYKQLYNDGKFQLFQNTQAIPRVKLFYNYEILNSDAEIIKRFYSEDFDFRNTLILEHSVKQLDKNGSGSTQIVSYSPTKVVVRVITDSPALLFFSDPYYPNWKAFVDDKEVTILRADYAFRGVVVKKGSSTIEFIYKPI